MAAEDDLIPPSLRRSTRVKQTPRRYTEDPKDGVAKSSASKLSTKKAKKKQVSEPDREKRSEKARCRLRSNSAQPAPASMKMETKPESSMEPPASPASKTSPSTGRGRQKRSAAREDDRPSKRSSGAGLDTDKPTKKPSSAGRGRQKQVAAEEVEQEPDTNIDKPTHLAPTDDARANQKRPREEDDEEEDYVGSSSKKQARTGCDSQKPTVSQEDNEPASDETPSRPNPSSNTRGTRKQREGRGGNRSGDGIRAPTASRSGNKTRADRERQATEEDQDPKLDNETLTEPDAPINLIKDQEQEADQEHADTDPPTTVRRSGRIKKTTLPFRKEATKSSRTPLPSSAPRQDLKRKASPKNSKDGEDEAEGGEEREEIFDLPDDLLEATLAPWKENELVQCRSWTELESEPVFLGEIMNSWGIEGATVKELLTIEQEALDALPNPVYGLVFLFQYESEDHPMNDKNEDIPWFANQTTSNACASIALMNIVMNIEGLPLGTKLEKLKEDTENLNPPQRGYVIANNPWLRAIHNSYARRIDLLDASLFLQNKFDSASQRKRWASTNKKTKATGAGGATNHYIGFVPVGKSVWHLDGLHREGPVHVGTFEDGQHWTTVVAPILQERMMKCATKNISFSLMALCAKEDPIHHLRIKLATNVRCIHDLQHRWGKVGDASFSDLVSSVVQDVRDDMIFWDTAEELEKYGLNKEEIDHLAIEEMVARVHSIDTAIAAADEWKKLCNQQMDLREDYDDALQGQIERTGCGRTEDFTPFIHEWIKQLDNHYPVLEELFTDAQHEEEIRRSGYDF